MKTWIEDGGSVEITKSGRVRMTWGTRKLSSEQVRGMREAELEGEEG